MINADSAIHELGLAVDVLIFGISHTVDKPENHYERVIMRTALCLLEVTVRHLRNQAMGREETNHA